MYWATHPSDGSGVVSVRNLGHLVAPAVVPPQVHRLVGAAHREQPEVHRVEGHRPRLVRPVRRFAKSVQIDVYRYHTYKVPLRDYCGFDLTNPGGGVAKLKRENTADVRSSRISYKPATYSYEDTGQKSEQHNK